MTIDFDSLTPPMKLAYICAEYDNIRNKDYSDDYIKQEQQRERMELIKGKFKLLKIMHKNELESYPDDLDEIMSMKDAM